jgi:hypothetical protein
MGRSDLIGSGEHHLVPRHDAANRGLAIAERRRETPGPNQLAKKFGQNKPRPGGAVVRTPVARTTTGRPAAPARPARKGAAVAAKGGRK